MSMKKSNDTIGNRTRGLPICSAVPQPTAPPRTPGIWCGYQKLGKPFLFNYICGFFIDTVVLFSHNDVTLGLWMLSFGSLLTFLWRHLYSKYYVLKYGCLRFLLYVTGDTSIMVLTFWLLVTDISTANCTFYLTKKSIQTEDGS